MRNYHIEGLIRAGVSQSGHKGLSPLNDTLQVKIVNCLLVRWRRRDLRIVGVVHLLDCSTLLRDVIAFRHRIKKSRLRDWNTPLLEVISLGHLIRSRK